MRAIELLTQLGEGIAGDSLIADAQVTLEVGGDGAVHSSGLFEIEFDLETNTLILRASS